MVLAICPPTLEADYHGPGSSPDIGLVLQLVWQAWLSSHLGSHQLTTHHYIQHYAAESFPGKDCKLLITCLTIYMSTHPQTYTGNVSTGTDAWEVVPASRAAFQMWSKLPTHGHKYSQKLFIRTNTCQHKPRIVVNVSDGGCALISIRSGSSIIIYPLRRNNLLFNLRRNSQAFSSHTQTHTHAGLATINVWVSPSGHFSQN